MAKKKITVHCFIERDGELIPWESFTEEEREEHRRQWSENLSRTMTSYFEQNPDAYIRTQKAMGML